MGVGVGEVRWGIGHEGAIGPKYLISLYESVPKKARTLYNGEK